MEEHFRKRRNIFEKDEKKDERRLCPQNTVNDRFSEKTVRTFLSSDAVVSSKLVNTSKTRFYKLPAAAKVFLGLK